jgi:hypothetical protein
MMTTIGLETINQEEELVAASTSITGSRKGRLALCYRGLGSKEGDATRGASSQLQRTKEGSKSIWDLAAHVSGGNVAVVLNGLVGGFSVSR